MNRGYCRPRFAPRDSLVVITREGPKLRATDAKDLLLAHALFQGVSRDAVEPLIQRVLIRRVARGSLLHSPGEHTPLNLVLTGGLRAYQLTADGHRLMLEIMGPGGFDGILAMLGERGHFTEAASDSVIACLEWSLISQLFAADQRVARNLVELVAERLERREEHLESMVIRNPTRKLARQLVALATALGKPDGENRIALPATITHQLLADMLGVRRETVTIHLHKLTKMGAIEAGGRPMLVYPRKLHAMAANGS